MESSVSSLRQFADKRKCITLRIRGPKDFGDNRTLANKLPYPKTKDMFDFKSTRRKATVLKVTMIENQTSLVDLILENRTKIFFIVISELIKYVCFKKFIFVRKFFRKIRKISDH